MISTLPESLVGSGAKTAVIGVTLWPPLALMLRSMFRNAVRSAPPLVTDSTGKLAPALSTNKSGVSLELSPIAMAAPHEEISRGLGREGESRIRKLLQIRE